MKHFTILCFAILSFNIVKAQIPIGRTVLEYQIERDGETLTMNGGGTKSWALAELYSAGLYLKNKSKDPIKISFENETMSIRIKFTSKIITRERMIDAMEEGFKKATNNDITPLKDRISLISKFYAKEIVKGDTLELTYIKDKGTICYFNERELGVIPGQDFKFALYKVWLGEEPVSKSLKKGMLGI